MFQFWGNQLEDLFSPALMAYDILSRIGCFAYRISNSYGFNKSKRGKVKPTKLFQILEVRIRIKFSSY